MELQTTSHLWIRALFLASCLAAWARGEPSGDWPCWRGENRNGISAEVGWNRTWAATPPKLAWRASIGKGFSACAVAGGRVFAMGNSSDVDTVHCLDLETGKSLWKHSYSCPLTPLAYEGGPSATPAVDGDHVYTLSKAGHVFCLNTANGRVVWSRKFDPAPRKTDDYRVDWGYAASPLVLGEKLILSVGWAGTALNKADGKTLWDNGPGRPGYSSPVPCTLGGQQCLVMLVARGIVGVETNAGRLLWTVPWRTTWDQNAADAIVVEEKMFVSTGHGVGCALYDIRGAAPKELWRNKNLRNELSSSVLWNGFVYGFDNDRLACVAWGTGEHRWTQAGLGRGSVIVVDGHLLALSDQGRLVLALATSEAFRSLGELQLPAEGRYWSAPAFSAGRILVRNAAGDLFSVDVQRNGEKSGPPE